MTTTIRNTENSKTNYWLLISWTALIFLSIVSCKKDDLILQSEEDIVLQSEKQIISFNFLIGSNSISENVIAQINEQAKTITAIMPLSTDLTALLPTIQISEGSSVNPRSAQDFSNSVNYIVTAEDGSLVTYAVRVTTKPSQREVLQAILDANPENTLDWDISNTENLNDLDRVKTNFKGEVIKLSLRLTGIKILPPEIGELKKLEYLDLEANELFAAKSIPKEIGQLSKLRVLSLRWANLAFLPKEIGNLKNLEELHLEGNNLKSIPKEIGQLLKLEYLNLAVNQFTSIPAEIGFLTNLETLYLERNKLSFLPGVIPYMISNTNLKYKQDKGVPFRTLPNSIDALISLYAANPTNNLGWGVDNYPGVSFTDDGNPKSITAIKKRLEFIPSNFSALVSLEVVDLSNNKLNSIPTFIGNMPNLNQINFHATNIKTVPSSLAKLGKLVLLRITNNPITSIPQIVCNRQISKGGKLKIQTDLGEGCE